MQRFLGLHRLVGNTPLLAIDLLYRGEPRVVYAKQESLNLTGSIKDRMALFIIEQAYLEGRLRPGDRIVEATSGNTGISFAAIGRALHHPITIFMPDWMSAERIALIATSARRSFRSAGMKVGFWKHQQIEELAASDPSVFLPRCCKPGERCCAPGHDGARI